jgi:transposase
LKLSSLKDLFQNFGRVLVSLWITVPSTRGKKLKLSIVAAGAILIYLPPYSPDFSPIENCFSKIKNILRSIGARTYSDLLKAIEEAFSQISLEDLKGWFTHCCYCTSLA